MYSRSYIPTKAVGAVPEGYDGIALNGEDFQEKLDTGGQNHDFSPSPDTPVLNPWEAESTPTKEEKAESVGTFSSLGSSLGGLFGGMKLPFIGSLKMPKIGTEEILILVAAAYLLFSKDGDKECAIMLLFLLFVT